MAEQAELKLNLNTIGALPDGEIDLAETALVLAALDHPDRDIQAYRETLDGLVRHARGLKAHGSGVASDVYDRAAVLHDAIYADGGFKGDTDAYDDPANANLMDVIDRKRGIPVSLGIILVHVARALGWDIAGLNFPGHFMLRLQAQGESCLVDPFDNARIVQMTELKRLLKGVFGADLPLKADFVRAVGNRDILLRLQNNLKTRALQADNTPRAVEVLRAMAMIAPDHSETNVELAALEAGQGNLRAAVAVLETYIGRGAAQLSDRDALRMLEELKRGLN